MQVIKKLLDDEIKAEIEELWGLEAGSHERLKAIEGIAKLYESKINHEKMVFEQTKNGYEASLKREELDLELAQLKEQKIDRYFRIGVDAAGIIMPLTFYWIWMQKGLKFEETGTFTSSTFRGLWNCFKPKK